jgi:hypothetical protein
MQKKCELCNSLILEDFSYLKNMSISGKIFGSIPYVISKFIPTSKLKERFIHGKKCF